MLNAFALEHEDDDQKQERWQHEPKAAWPICRHKHGSHLIAGRKTVFGGFAAKTDQTDRDLVADGYER